jgi:hypothetical protein
MSVKTNQYISQTSQDTGGGPSQGIWGDCPLEDLIQSFGGGIGTFGNLIQDDFCPLASPSNTTPAIGTLGQWACWLASGMTVTDGVEEGGVAKFDGTTANKSSILTSNAGMFRFIGPTPNFVYAGGKFWMEARIALGSVAASQQGVFFGLADNTSSQINSSDTTIIASGGNTLTTTKNLLGFFNRTTTSPADWSVVYQPAAGTAVYPTGLTTIVNDVTGVNEVAYAASSPVGHGTGFVKIGMVYDPGPANPTLQAPSSPPSGQTAGNLYRPIIKFFVNGQLHPKFLTGVNVQATTFPTNCVFAPVFNYMNIAGATAPVYLDWVRFAQLGSF